jgi:hypothetical protein
LKMAAWRKWQVLAFDISALTMEAVKPFGLGNKEALRCKNMWTLGLALWMFDRDRAADDRLAQRQVAKKNPVLADANIAALNAGHAYGETAESADRLHQAASMLIRCRAPPGLYRTVTGAEAISLGPCRRRAARRPADVLRRLSDHARLGDPAQSGAASRNSASPPSRRKTRSRRSASAIGASYAGSWASPRRPAPASR